MANRWQELWNNRQTHLDSIDMNDKQQVILELKRMVGWDHFGKDSDVVFEEFQKEYEYIKQNLELPVTGNVFEVGCGSGSNLYFFSRDGYKVGGSDYAENMLAVVDRVIGVDNLLECVCDDAADLNTDIKYDAVFAAAVFQYFNDIDYAEKVLNRMVAKSNKSVGIIRMFKAETKDEYIKYRRETTPNYDELYKDLPKLFLSEEFFRNFAAKNNLRVKFDHLHIKDFWNDPYIFDCFLYK